MTDRIESEDIDPILDKLRECFEKNELDVFELPLEGNDPDTFGIRYKGEYNIVYRIEVWIGEEGRRMIVLEPLHPERNYYFEEYIERALYKDLEDDISDVRFLPYKDYQPVLSDFNRKTVSH